MPPHLTFSYEQLSVRMSHITCIYHLGVEPANLEPFKALIEKIVAATSLEPGTLIYEYSASHDEREVHIVERYLPNAVLPHVEQTFAPYADEFLKLAKIERVYVYGTPSSGVREKLEPFGPVYMSPIAGFFKPFA
jgi:quinol monooxygenase YgiN